jgi:hypothetical protein
MNFEINPLDINIAKIQFNLINKLNNSNENSYIIETFENKDPRLDLAIIKIICTNNTVLKAEFSYKNNESHNIELFNGSKEKLLEYLQGKAFFDTCKNISTQK